MKVNDSFLYVKLDNKTRAKSVSDELNWMWNDILEDYAKIEEMWKKLFYKQNEFDRICQKQLEAFNSRCAMFYMKEKFEKHFSNEIDIAKDKVFLSAFIANYFPKWMWPSLTFRKVEYYNYGDQWWVSFVWNPRKKVEFRPIIQICITNPENINVQDLYDPAEEHKMKCMEEHHKTVVEVYGNSEFCSEWVGEAYMNNEIIDIIDKWAKGFLNGNNNKKNNEVD